MLNTEFANYTLYSIFYFFVIYSFLGWIFESTVVSINTKRLVNRGFLNGPFCPIYAVGAVSIIFILTPFKYNVMYVYFGSCIVATLLEYIIGFGMEKLFHTRWWDYSENKFNINGRVCLSSTIAWGFLSILMMYFMQPRVEILVNKIPLDIGISLALFLIFYFLVDTMVTIHNVITLNGKLETIKIAVQEVKLNLNNIKQMDISEEFKLKINNILCKLENKRANIHELEIIEQIKSYIEQKDVKSLDSIKENYLKIRQAVENNKNIFNKRNFIHERFINAYPHIKSVDFDEYLIKLKQSIKNRKNK